MNPFEKAINQNPSLEPEIITTELAVVAELEKQEIIGSKSKMIQAAFEPMVAMLKVLESDYNEIIALDVTKPDTAKKAKDLRLKMVKVRTGTAAIHKEQKAEYLRAGRAIDGVNNILKWAVEDKEEQLAKIENYTENIAKEARKKIFEERLALLSQVISKEEAQLIPLGDLAPETFENMLNGYKFAKAERERVAKEQEENERKAKAEKDAEDLRIRQELEDLKKQSEEKARIQLIVNRRINQITGLGFKWSEPDESYVSEVNAMNIGMIEIKLMTDHEFNEVYSKFEKIMDAHKAKVRKLQEATELKLKNERAERKRLEDLAKAKQEQEETERKAKLAAERKMKRAPDKNKLLAFAEHISLVVPPELKEDESKEILNNAIGLLAKVTHYIKTNAGKL